MVRLWWDDVRDYFDPHSMGSLPDVRIDDTTVADWQALFDLVRDGDWPWSFHEGLDPTELPTAAAVFARPADAEVVDLRVEFAEEAVAIFRPYSDESIDFDVDLRFLQGQERLDRLCDFFAVLGRHLRRSVWMSSEGGGRPLLGFDVTADRMVVVDAKGGRR